MEISALNAFISVARHSSFSAAAKELYLTQPAVSKRVAALEEELGIKLFHRVSRHVTLTEAGKQLLKRAKELVEHADDMQRYAANLNSDISGKLSIAIAHHIGLHRMPPILQKFNQQFPQVALDIHFEDSDRACLMVEQGDIEFAVITLPSKPPDRLHIEVVWEDPLEIVIGPDHEFTNREEISLQDLSKLPCVLPERGTETHKIVRRWVEKVGGTLKVQMQTNNLESLKMLVAAGIGWSALPSTMLDDSVEVLKVQVSKVPLDLRRELGMVFHHRRSLSNAAQALIGLIRQPIE
jgi:DNA-binding transcriptional LysR family regulator